jgi:hypothetical protein
VAAFTAAMLASAWLAVAAWGGRESATPLPAQQQAGASPSEADSGYEDSQEDEAPSMSTGQS